MEESNYPHHPPANSPPPLNYPVARALLVGVQKVDAKKYNGWDGSNIAKSVIRDIGSISALLKKQVQPMEKIEVTTLLTETETTALNILNKLKEAASKSRSGDLFIFYFCGHGGIFVTPNERDKGFLNTLCCYDTTIWSTQLKEIWKLFQPNVRIVMISSSCHSSSNNAISISSSHDESLYSTPLVDILTTPGVGKVPKQRKLPGMTAMMIHYAACEDAELSYAFDTGSVFTQALVKVLNAGNFHGNHEDLYNAILKETAGAIPKQVAQYNELGPFDTFAFQRFREQRPFTREFHFALPPHSTTGVQPISEDEGSLREQNTCLTTPGLDEKPGDFNKGQPCQHNKFSKL